MRLVMPGGHGPVDLTGVITRDIRTSFSPFGPMTREETGVVAGKQPHEAALHGQLQPL
jgi:hypothetical protein